MKRLNDQQIEIIKGLKEIAIFLDLECYQLQMNDNDYKALTGIDLNTLDRMYGNMSVYYEVRYCKCGEHFEVQYTTMIKDSPKDELSGVFECDDFLELFSTKEEKTEDIHEKLQELFENHFDEFENFLKEKDYIRKEDITADDIDDSLKEDIACSYIEEYPTDSCDKALSNMSSYDSKEVIINYLQDIL